MSEASDAPGILRGMSARVEKTERLHSIRDGLFCAFAVVICVLITDPAANTPFSDGFSYAKTALDFSQTGRIVYNGWATAMLGWLIPWGALFIKVFGFSFTVMRLSMLPIDFAAIFLFHQVLRRFGITPQNAVFGTFALAFSPIFFPSAAMFMTDMPGLLVILVCIYMCQRVVATRDDRSALVWLAFAAAVNLIGGTARQIAWLGALIMVPSTAWLMRERRGMKTAGAVLFLFSLFGVLGCLHWFNSQPYSVPEHIIWAPVRFMNFVHLGGQAIKAFLCLLLLAFPVFSAWLPGAHRLKRNAWLRFAGVMAFTIAFFILAYALNRIDMWLMPWLMFLLEEQSSLVPGMFGTPNAMVLWIRAAISLLVIGAAWIVAEQMMSRKRNRLPVSNTSSLSEKSLVWILCPFACSYFLLLTPRGAFALIQDRYLLGLTPIVIILLLWLYQETMGSKLPAISFILLGLFAVYSVAGTHDFFAESRAQMRAIQMVERAGVPRTFIMAGFPDDGWVQIQDGGHINEPRLRVPAGAYDRKIVNPYIPEACRDPFTQFTPAITPKYFIPFPWFKDPFETHPGWCYVPAEFPPIRYVTWLPPFKETLLVQRLRNPRTRVSAK